MIAFLFAILAVASANVVYDKSAFVPQQQRAIAVQQPRIVAVNAALPAVDQVGALRADLRPQYVARSEAEVFRSYSNEPESYGYQIGPVSFQYTFTKSSDLANQQYAQQGAIAAQPYAIAPQQYAAAGKIVAEPVIKPIEAQPLPQQFAARYQDDNYSSQDLVAN